MPQWENASEDEPTQEGEQPPVSLISLAVNLEKFSNFVEKDELHSASSRSSPSYLSGEDS